MPDGVLPVPLCVEGGDSLISANYANRVIVPLNAILQSKIAPIANIGAMKYAGGQFIFDFSVLDARLQKIEAGVVSGNIGGGSLQYPFQISQLDNTTINVRYGTVHNIAPNGVAENIALSGTANYLIYINASIDANGRANSAVIINTTGNIASDDPNFANKLIGVVTIASNIITTINQSLYFSQDTVACGRNVSDIVNSPGMPYYWMVD